MVVETLQEKERYLVGFDWFYVIYTIFNKLQRILVNERLPGVFFYYGFEREKIMVRTLQEQREYLFWFYII